MELICSRGRLTRAVSHVGCVHCDSYARRMGQPTQRATNYTARSNIEPAQIFLHANGQSAPRSGGARFVGRDAGTHPPIEHGLGVLPALTALAQHITHSHSGIDEKRPTEKGCGG